jgi:Xaa-Pro aminopeptidase
MTTQGHMTPADFAPRLAAARRILREREADCAIIMGPEAQYWLCGLDSFLGALIPQALILAADGGAPVLVVWDADAALARQTSILEDVRTFRFGVDEPAALFVQVARSVAPGLTRIAIDLSSRAIPFAFGNALAQGLAGRDLVDITPDLARLRAVKSPAEMELMRIAGTYSLRGLEAARRHARPGMTEIKLAAEVEYAMRLAGSDYCSIPTEMTSGSRSLFGHGTPVDRVLEPGDLVHLEIGGVERRYNCVAMQTLVVPGARPKQAARDLYDVALRCLRAGLQQLRPGVPAAEVERPALEIIRRAGLGDAFKMRFGYGVGIGYPPSWLEQLQITRTSTDVLDVGTTFVLHACLLDERESIGVLVGGTYAITGEGYELLGGAGDVELT